MTVDELRAALAGMDGATEVPAELLKERRSLTLVRGEVGKSPHAVTAPTVSPIASPVAQVMARVGAKASERDRNIDQAVGLRSLIFAYWQRVHGHPRAKWVQGSPGDRKIRDRLREDEGDPNRCLYAIDGARRDDFLMGKNGGRKYDELPTILRDNEQATRLAENIAGFGKNQQHDVLSEIEAAMRPSGDMAVQA